MDGYIMENNLYYTDINTTYQAFVYACGETQFHQLRLVAIPPKPPHSLCPPYNISGWQEYFHTTTYSL